MSIDGTLEFDALGQRIHPTESRVNLIFFYTRVIACCRNDRFIDLIPVPSLLQKT